MKTPYNRQAAPSDEFSPLDKEHYREVDMLFNIGRVEGVAAQGFDGINRHTKERHYFAANSDAESERKIIEALGSQAVLSCIKRDPETGDALYHVPMGTRLLVKTLEVAPYNATYMERLQNKAEEFLDDLRQLDKDRFGITIDRLALAHNGHDEDHDDVYITAIPPVKSEVG